MKFLLSLDLGITTGYCVLRMEPFKGGRAEIEEHGTILFQKDAPNAVQKYEGILQRITLDNLVSFSVAERPVIYRGALGADLQRVVDATSAVLMRQVEFVDPTRWKSTPFRRHPTPKNLTPHERDAIRLAYWYTNELQGKE